MKVCVFCTEPGGSREHIVSKSVQERTQTSDVEVEVGVRDETGDGQFRSAHVLNAFTTQRVCDACNRGWMSQLEADFLAVVGPLIEPEWPKLENEFIREAVMRSEVIARWIVKTAITANLAGVIKRGFPDEIPINLRLGKLPPSLTVKLAHIKKRNALSIIIHRGFWFLDGKEKKWRGEESGKSFDVLFQLNHLAIRAINAPGAQIGFALNKEKVFPLTAFPSTISSPVGGYSFETLNDFEQILITRLPPSGKS